VRSDEQVLIDSVTGDVQRFINTNMGYFRSPDEVAERFRTYSGLPRITDPETRAIADDPEAMRMIQRLVIEQEPYAPGRAMPEPLAPVYGSLEGRVAEILRRGAEPEELAPVAERVSRSIMPAPQRFFDPADRAYKPFLQGFEPEAGGRYLEMRRGESPRDVTGERVGAARIAVGPDGRPSMLVGDPTDLPTGSPGKGSTTTKTNLFKRSAGWDWTEAPEGYADVPTLVSVENRGKHYYALSAEFPKGVDLARYADAPSEPRLRPTTQGNVNLGQRVGTIKVRGKEHPVYDLVTVRSMAPIGGLAAAAAAEESEDDSREELARFAMGGQVDVNEANPNYAGDEGITATDRALEGIAQPQRLATGGQPRGGPRRPAPTAEERAALYTRLEQQYDLPEGYLARVRAIESSDGTRLFNRNSRAAGPFQFIPRTATAMGLRDPYDEIASAEAAARLAADNAQALRRRGFEVDAPTLYLAHQQGATGAVRLLQGNRPAVDIVGRNAVLLNAGSENMTGPEFAGRVLDYFRGVPAQPAQAAPAQATAPAEPPAIPRIGALPPVQASAQPAAQAPAQQPAAPAAQAPMPIPFPPPPAPPVPAARQRRADDPSVMRDVIAGLEMQGSGASQPSPIERHLQMVQQGQRRYATAMPEQEPAMMAQGGLARTLGAMGRGNDTLVAHITPREALMLAAMGGSGTTNPYTGLLEFDDGGGDGGGGDGGGGDGSDGGGADSGGGGEEGGGYGDGSGFADGQSYGAGPDAAFGGMADDGFGGGPTGSFGGGFGAGFGAPDGLGEGWGDVDWGAALDAAPASGPASAPASAPASTGRGFGQAGFGTLGSALGSMAGFATGMPGLGLAGAALGTMADVQALNADLESMGLPGNVSFGPALASNVSFGTLGQSAVNQFGQTLGFDALAEAPLSAYSSPVGPPAESAPANGSDSGPTPPVVSFNTLPDPVQTTSAPTPVPQPAPAPGTRSFSPLSGDPTRYGFGGERSFYTPGYAEGGRVSPELSYEAQRFLDLIREANLEASGGGVFTPIPGGRVVAGGVNARAAVPVGRDGAALDFSGGQQGVSASGRGFRSNQSRMTGAGVGYTTPSGGRLSLDYHDRMMGDPDTLPGADPIELMDRPAPSRGLRLGYRREF
jgi:hypothetical protein